MTQEPQYAIGQQFMTRGCTPRLCTIVDIHKTYNAAGDLVKYCYVATHEFMGQTLTDCEVPEATVTRGLIA